MKKSVRTHLIRVIYAILLFVACLFIFSLALEERPRAYVQETAKAALPVVTIQAGNVEFNELHGYTQERDLSKFHPVLTPLGTDRRITMLVNTFGEDVTAMSYEVRTLSGERLIERTQLEVPESVDNVLTVTYTLKDLVNEEEEYVLDLVLSTGQTTDIRYYTRICCSEDNNESEQAGTGAEQGTETSAGNTSDTAEEDAVETTAPLYQAAVAFVEEFHEKTIEGTDTAYLSDYIEPEDTGDSLETVDIHSSLSQVAFLDLTPTEAIKPVYSLTEMSGTQLCLNGSYIITIDDQDSTENSGNTTTQNTANTRRAQNITSQSTVSLSEENAAAQDDAVGTVQEPADGVTNDGLDSDTALHRHWYLCTEYYRINKGFDRFHLINFQRTMTEIFDPATTEYTSDMIELGISNPDMQVMASSDGDSVAFVSCGRLILVNVTNNSVHYIFGYGEADSTDRREMYPAHDIRILSVENGGNVDFLVYGYANAGVHEGSVGLAEYHYDAQQHTIEEQACLSYAGSYELLREQVGNGIYLNEKDQLYLLLDDVFYRIDLSQKNVYLADELQAGSTVMTSEDGRMVAWDEPQGSGDIVFTDLSNFSQRRISPEEGETLVLIGFMREDLIYGIIRDSDRAQDAAGVEVAPMYRLQIVDHDLQVLEDYEEDSYYVTEAVIDNNQVTLHRIQWIDGGYVEAEDDQIVDTTAAASGSALLSTSSDSDYGTVQRLTVSGFAPTHFRYVESRKIMDEQTKTDLSAQREELLQNTADNASRHFYVYGIYGYERNYRYPADAVQRAAAGFGVVIGGDGSYIWRRTAVERCQLDEIGTGLLRDESGTNSSNTGSTYAGGSAVNYREAITNGDMTTLSACLDCILRYENVSVEVGNLLSQGEDTTQILEENISGSTALDLSGCSMENVLYYPSIGIPVIAQTTNGTVLIIGYGPERIAIWDPAGQETQLMTRTRASLLFSTAGNRFFTYVKAQE